MTFTPRASANLKIQEPTFPTPPALRWTHDHLRLYNALVGLPRGAGPLFQRRTTIYAIVRTGGKQYRVEPNQVLDIDRVKVDVGSTLELTDVLLIGDNGEVCIGTPLVDGARILAEVIEHGRDEKIRVFKYKNKTRYRRRFGHRQQYTRLAIRRIVTGAEGEPEATEVQKPKRAARKRPGSAAAAAEALPAAEAAEAPAAKPRRRARPAQAEVPTEEAPETKPARRARTPKAQAEAAAAKPSARPRRRKDAGGSTERSPARRPSTSRKTEQSGE
jgi:large subunit ribosomal protein L21